MAGGLCILKSQVYHLKLGAGPSGRSGTSAMGFGLELFAAVRETRCQRRGVGRNHMCSCSVLSRIWRQDIMIALGEEQTSILPLGTRKLLVISAIMFSEMYRRVLVKHGLYWIDRFAKQTTKILSTLEEITVLNFI